MKTIKKLVLERLKLNKDTKIYDDSFSKDNCIFVPFEARFRKLITKYFDYRISPEKGYIIFIIPIKVVKRYNRFEGKLIYKIPSKYHDFEELKDDYMQYNLKINDLEKLEI